MTFFSKLRWVASILLVFFIVLITNIIDRDNFNRLSYSVTTMYEDRIVASDLLFEMDRIIEQKKIAILANDTSFRGNTNFKSNQELEVLLNRYNQTKLTERERLIFAQLQEEIKTIKQNEQEAGSLSNQETLNSIEKASQHLYDLSKIQLQEGKRQVRISDKAMNAINLFTQGEIIFLIITAVLVQIIILYKPKESGEP